MFGKKEKCPVCGGKVGLLHTNLGQEKICLNCSKEIGGIADTHLYSLNDFLQFKNFVFERNNWIFSPDYKDTYIEIDHQNEIIHFSKQYGRYFKFDELESLEIVEDGETISKSGLGRAVAGGLLFGGAGAVVGSITGKKQKEMVNSLKIILKINSKWIDKKEILLLDTPTKKDGITYKLGMTNANNLKDMLEKCVSSTSSASSNDSMSQLIQLKQLLDQGIITQSDFEIKKKQILGI